MIRIDCPSAATPPARQQPRSRWRDRELAPVPRSPRTTAAPTVEQLRGRERIEPAAHARRASVLACVAEDVRERVPDLTWRRERAIVKPIGEDLAATAHHAV